MEQDQKLKELLLLGSERASLQFTEGVMKRVERVAATPFYCQPLVSPRLRKAFLITVSVLVAAIFLLCLLLASPELAFPGWPVVQSVVAFTAENFYTLLAYIISFWILFAANAFIEKKANRQRAAAL